MKRGITLTYLHTDQPFDELRASLGSTVLETSTTGATTAGQQRDA